MPAQDYSSQSYYYNLYIRDSEQGDINLSNARYFCPSVQEALGNNGTVGTANKPWPLDRTFALSLGATTVFNVGVQAFTQLSDGSTDPDCPGIELRLDRDDCFTDSGRERHELVGKYSRVFVLGIRRRTRTPTAPALISAIRIIRFASRIVCANTSPFIPRSLTPTDTPLQQAQSSDTIYVLDRPVNNGANPLQPYTMAGPKPCPWSYYDRSGANGVPDAYYPETGLHRPGLLGDEQLTLEWKKRRRRTVSSHRLTEFLFRDDSDSELDKNCDFTRHGEWIEPGLFAGLYSSRDRVGSSLCRGHELSGLRPSILDDSGSASALLQRRQRKRGLLRRSVSFAKSERLGNRSVQRRTPATSVTRLETPMPVAFLLSPLTW